MNYFMIGFCVGFSFVVVNAHQVPFESKIVQRKRFVIYKLIAVFVICCNVIHYQTADELKDTFKKGYFIERAMGASIYGDDVQKLYQVLSRKHLVSVNETLFDIEDGNKPFGGYGPMANYVSYKKELHIKPILLSKMVSELMGSGD